jgi:hypothetical protein
MINEQEKPEESATVELEFNADELSAKSEKFSILSADMTKILSDLSSEVKRTWRQFQAVQSAVDLKREELKSLHDLDVSAASLKQLIEDQRLQKGKLERLMESQRSSWEEEKTRLDRENNEYRDKLAIQRQREEAELLVARQEYQKMREEIELQCLEREQTLHERELELGRLIQEIERFMSKIDKHDKPPNAALPNLHKIEQSDQSNFETDSNAIQSCQEPWYRREGGRSPADIGTLNSLISDKEEGGLAKEYPAASMVGNPAKRDSTTLRFSLKKTSNSTPEAS